MSAALNPAEHGALLASLEPPISDETAMAAARILATVEVSLPE